MSRSSARKRILQTLVGGSALWLGTTFCSPVAAIDLELPPTPASAPDALAAPEQTAEPSIIPPALLEAEQADHWDTGPVFEEGLCANDAACESARSDGTCGQCEEGYNYVAPEKPYAANVDNPVEDSCCDDAACCHQYAYQGYDANMVGHGDSADGLVQKPEDAVYSDIEHAYDDYGYDYDATYAHDEHAYTPADEMESADEDDCDSNDQYVYDYEQEYGDYADDMNSLDEQAEEIEETQVVEDTESSVEDETSYEFDDYEMYYGYDEEMDLDEERAEEVEETQVAEDTESSVEDEPSHEFDDYEMYYGYDEEMDLDEEQAEEAATIEQEIAEESAESPGTRWEDYYYGNEYEYYRDEYETESQASINEANAEVCGEEAWAENYGYEAHEDDANETGYDMEDAYEGDAVTEQSSDTTEESYDYADPMEHYGYEYAMPDAVAVVEKPSQVDARLFSRRPTELLGKADCDLIRSIGQLVDEPIAVRRVRWNKYIEDLGFEAIDFAYRYEDATDSDVLTLANDLPGAAAFLASFRLFEQGQVTMDDAVVILEEALSGLSLDWIEAVGRMTASEQADASAPHPVVEAMAAAATHSIDGMSALASAISVRLAEVPWAEISSRLAEVRSASLSDGKDTPHAF